MKVKTRSGKLEDLSLDKIKNRINNLVQKYTLNVDVDSLTLMVISSLHENVSTSELDDETARIAANNISELDSLRLASIISIDNHHKSTEKSFIQKFTQLYEAGIIDEPYFRVVQEHGPLFEEQIDYEFDFCIDYFGFKTLERAYLLKVNNKIVERPQDLFMRVALALHTDTEKSIADLNKVFESYKYFSQGYMTHATPTLFHACTKKTAYSSCFLLGTGDSISEMYETVKNCALISKHAGGIGLHVSNIRAKGSHISGSGGKAGGLVPYLRTLNNTALHVDQNSKRPGSFALYIEPYHPDIFDFLEMKINKTKEEFRALDLFYALWIPDLFMKRVKEDGDWYLMCPHECPGLNDVYGDQFENLYNYYVSSGKYRKKIKAQELWKAILKTQTETGTPYLCYKDASNKKSNQKNLGTIKSSNLCVAPETMILTSNGYFPIKDLENQKVEVWNGQKWSSTTIRKTGSNQKLLNIYFNNSHFIDCTPYHKFYIQTPEGIQVVEAKNLKPGMALIDCDYPIIDNLSVKPYQEYDDSIPINDSIERKLRYLENFIQSEEYKITQDELQGVKIEHANEYGFIDYMRLPRFINLKYMLQTLGCNPALQYDYQVYRYKLVLTVKDINVLRALGFQSSLITIEGNYPNYKKNIVCVEKVLITGRISDTYCFTEPERGMGIFNGLLLGNCSEIIQYSDKDNVAVCNLASIGLPKFVKIKESGEQYFDFQLLRKITGICVQNLNNVIDKCFYPIPEARKTNLAYRPIGLGVQGLAYTYMALGYAFDSKEAKKLNLEIFETIYYSALEKSMELSKIEGPYQNFDTSPASQGKLQFDLWKETHPDLDLFTKISGRWNWNALKQDIQKYGLRNSLLTTCMPTASTSQILGNSEAIEAITSNMFIRRVISGEFIVFNPFLLKDLQKLNLWNKDMKDLLQYYNGSVQKIDTIPDSLKQKYKTVWEISQKAIIDQASDRGLFIDQSQSLNLSIENPTYSKLTSMHFYAWEKGLKTGIYYLRTKSPSSSDKVTIDKERIAELLSKKETSSCPYIPGQGPPDCEACSS